MTPPGLYFCLPCVEQVISLRKRDEEQQTARLCTVRYFCSLGSWLARVGLWNSKKIPHIASLRGVADCVFTVLFSSLLLRHENSSEGRGKWNNKKRRKQPCTIANWTQGDLHSFFFSSLAANITCIEVKGQLSYLLPLAGTTWRNLFRI